MLHFISPFPSADEGLHEIVAESINAPLYDLLLNFYLVDKLSSMEHRFITYIHHHPLPFAHGISVKFHCFLNPLHDWFPYNTHASV